MVDNNLNPGDQRYNDLYSGQGGVNELRDLSAVRDYSASKDFSSLKQGEQNAINQYTTASDRDIRQQEAASHMDASSFDKIMSMDTKKLDEKRYNQMSSFKKRIFGGVLVFLTGGGLLMGIGTAISGPMQLIQAAELINDFQLAITSGQQAARSLQSTTSLVRAAKAGLSNSIETSRLGILGKKQADAVLGRMSKNGVEINTSIAGYQIGNIEIDANKLLGGSVNSSDINAAADLLGVSANKIEIIDGGNKIRLKNNLNYSEAKRFIKAVDDPGKWKLSSWMQGRVTLKKLGYTSWLHPIEKAKTKANMKLWEFIDVQVGKIMKPDTTISERIKNTDTDIDDGLDKSPDLDAAQNDAKPRAKDKPRAITKASDTLKSMGVDVDNLKNVLGKLAGVTAIVSVICLINSLYKNAGIYKQSNIVAVAEKGAAQLLGYGSQVKSGEDINLDSAKLATKMALGDDIAIEDEGGNDTGKKEFSSFWGAAPVCSTLGTANCDTSPDNLPGGINMVADDANIFPNKKINSFFASYVGSGTVKTICKIIGPLADAIDLIVDFVGEFFSRLIMTIISGTDVFGTFMNTIWGMMYGKPLDLAAITPEQWGSVGMYGGKFMSNDQSRGVGGRELESSESIALNLENRRYLAWEHSRKPLLARLADPSDYASSINQMARAINLNTSSQDFGTQLANVIKTFTSAPTLIATASNQLLGGSAYAASAYDYGVPTFAYSVDELDEMLEDESYNLINNTEQAIHLLENGDGEIQKTEFYSYAETCLGVEISNDEQHSVKLKEYNENDEDQWNYVYNTGKAENAVYCKDKNKIESYKRIRLYIMDYFNTVSSACYYGDASDGDSASACEEMQVESGTTSAGGVGAIDTAGNQEPSAWQETFASESNNGTYGGYDTRTNGCTTISAWFIGAHTDLTYGNGHGRQVVEQLVAANPDAGLEVTTKPTKAPALFSSTAPGMNATTAQYGHVGLITAIDPDGTIHTLESGSNAGKKGKPWSFTDTHSPSDYASNTTFVYLGDHLK